MSSYEEAIEKFFTESRDLGIGIHTDYEQAKRIFEAIEKNVNFESIITQTNSTELIKECNAFGSIILDWVDRYPKLLNNYRQILAIVIEDLKEIKGITVIKSGNNLKLNFNNEEFNYNFNNNMNLNSSNIIISENDKEKITLEENKIVQELAEVISLDLYILDWLEHIESLNSTYHVKMIAQVIKNMTKIVSSEELVTNLNMISLWWMELRKQLDKLKEVTKTAVQMDEKVTKELMEVFNREDKENIRDSKLRAAKAGIGLLFTIALNIIPGGAAISTIAHIYKERKLYSDAIRCLK